MTGTGGGAEVPYQYVVLRCVPRVDREEFLNVGVVLHCQASDFLAARWRLHRDRLARAFPDLDLDAVAATLETVEGVCSGEPAPGRPVIDGLGRRFGWLSAPRSTVVQPGPVHGGVCLDPAEELARLCDRLVGRAAS